MPRTALLPQDRVVLVAAGSDDGLGRHQHIRAAAAHQDRHSPGPPLTRTAGATVRSPGSLHERTAGRFGRDHAQIAALASDLAGTDDTHKLKTEFDLGCCAGSGSPSSPPVGNRCAVASDASMAWPAAQPGQPDIRCWGLPYPSTVRLSSHQQRGRGPFQREPGASRDRGARA